MFMDRLYVLAFLLVFGKVNGHFLRSLADQCPTDPGESPAFESTSSLILTFKGMDATTFTSDDYQALADTFKTAYESEASCFFLTDVTIDTETDNEARRLSQETRSLTDTSGEVVLDLSLCIQVSYGCYYCPDGSTLFTNDGSRRLNFEDFVESVESFFSTSEKKKGPSRQKFMAKFNEILAGKSLPVKELQDASEMRPITCEIAKDNKTTLKVHVDGDASYLFGDDLSEIQVIEKAIKKAYNTLNTSNREACDGYFRRVKDVRYTKEVERSGDGFAMSFDIEYSCRGCHYDSESSLLDELADGSSDRTGNLHVDLRESGPVTPVCACDVDAEVIRGPTSSEVTLALQRLFDTRQLQRKLSFVDSVDGVEEL